MFDWICDFTPNYAYISNIITMECIYTFTSLLFTKKFSSFNGYLGNYRQSLR